MLKKFCRCGKIIPQDISMCSECEAKFNNRKKQGYKDYKNKRTDIKEQKFYSKSNHEWNLTRAAVINRDEGLCILCDSNNKEGYAEEVHHIIELKEDWSRRLDMTNLVSLCKRCHYYTHKKYNKDNKSKIEMQNKLKQLIKQNY